MLCKNENRDPAHCLKEGRKVTRCTQEVISKIRESCLAEFDAHWKCLENNNQVGWKEERRGRSAPQEVGLCRTPCTVSATSTSSAFPPPPAARGARFRGIPTDIQYFQACRKPERALNSCVFSKLGLKKEIPGAPAGTQIHEIKNPIVTAVQK
jgi:NADH dehydrogenase (ubiquinone) 1 alpha subcomplex subunit 8